MESNGIVVYQFNNVNYILRECLDFRGDIANPNFRGTNLALVGILRPNESVDSFVDRINGMHKELSKRAEKAINKHISNIRKDEKMQHK